MTIDHLGAILFPEYIILRIIGRLSFPIFCYLIALGVETTRSIKNYFVRLLIFAFASQIPFSLAFRYKPLEVMNIFFTLSFGTLFFIHPLLILLSLSASYFLNFDYGPYGIILIISMYILRRNWKQGVFLIILINAVIFFGSEIQPLSLLVLPVISLHMNRLLGNNLIERGSYPSWRKYLFYIYYPAHLSVLYLVKAR